MNLQSLLFSFSFIALSAHADTWNGYNDPSMMDVDHSYEFNLNKLPLQGTLDRMPWSETYWPTFRGSINYRWNAVDKDGFNYYPPTKDVVLHMSQADLMQLSPTEKYDIFMGHYDYPLHEEVRSYGNSGAPQWQGMCDGWSIAALQFSEPMPVTMANPDGVMVPFGSSDIKALMTFAAAIHFEVETRQVGSKCEAKTGFGRQFSAACADINPGALHVIMANQFGIKKQGFVTERDPGYEVWNQPTYGFKSTLMGSTNRGVRVHGTLFYTDELDNSSWTPIVGTPAFKFDKIEMDYTLDLDDQGNIIGGSWINGSDHPDFVWLPTNKLIFKDGLDGLNKLYQASGK